MGTGKTPAFYALDSNTPWKAYVNLLHVPYTLWHLSYVVLGAAIAPTVHLGQSTGTGGVAVQVGRAYPSQVVGVDLSTAMLRRA